MVTQSKEKLESGLNLNFKKLYKLNLYVTMIVKCHLEVICMLFRLGNEDQAGSVYQEAD